MFFESGRFMEIWKPTPSHLGVYETSNLGRFRSPEKIDAAGRKRKQRYLTEQNSKDGYKKINFFPNGRQKKCYSHRVVWETFVGPIPIGLEVNHKNGIRDDNRIENIELLTHSENILYSKNILKTNYATFGNAKITKENFSAVFLLREEGKTHKQIALQVGLKKSQVGNILNKKSWVTGR
jgi:hypothetical protein